MPGIPDLRDMDQSAGDDKHAAARDQRIEAQIAPAAGDVHEDERNSEKE